MARTIICLKCKQEKDHDSRGLCHTCYSRMRLNNRLEEFPKLGKPKRKTAHCNDCGKHSLIEAKGLCRNCYARRNYHKNKSKKKRVVCAFCGEKKAHQAKGLCRACYIRAWRNGGIPIGKRKRQRKRSVCIDCGVFGDIHARNRCRLCYARWHRKNNREIYREYDRKYRKEDPQYIQKALNHKRKRRNRKKGLPATLTEKEWSEILKRHDYSCAYCGKKTKKLQREHWIPLVKGGGYTSDNIVPACRSCNCKKGTMTGNEFIELTGDK